MHVRTALGVALAAGALLMAAAPAHAASEMFDLSSRPGPGDDMVMGCSAFSILMLTHVGASLVMPFSSTRPNLAFAIDAKTGMRVQSFGTNGAIDLKADDSQKIEPDLTTGEIGWQSAPTVAGDVVLVGSAFREGFTPTSFKNNKGSARAFDVRTGKRLWQFRTIPQKGEPGAETWLNGSNEYTGNTGVWTQITADPVANLAYLPVESPTSDFYGGKRHGSGLYANSLVAVDLTPVRPESESAEPLMVPVNLPNGATFGRLPQSATPAAWLMVQGLVAIVLAVGALVAVRR